MSRKVFYGKPIGERIDGTRRDDEIYGYGGNDNLQGHRGNDLIEGGGGNDKIKGGEDHDTLSGNAGADSFIFNKIGAAHSDVLKDFEHGTDRFLLDSFTLTSLDPGKLSAGEFVAGTKALDGNDHIIYNEKTGDLYFDSDGNGTHKQFLLAHLDNKEHLTAGDFFVF